MIDYLKEYPTKDQTAVRVIADSIGFKDDRLTSVVATFPRYLLAELNTHRIFTRNSASSRAIPMPKMIKSIKENPYMPQINEWMKEHTGMQGYEYYTPEEVIAKGFINDWIVDRDYTVKRAQMRADQGLSKQIGNRHLESFMWHTAIVSATEWENFLNLRVSPYAEPQFQKLAGRWLEALNTSIPKKLHPGDWHIPFGDEIDMVRLHDAVIEYQKLNGPKYSDINLYKVMIAVARCARISYTVFGTDIKDDYLADFKLYTKLDESGHMSPFENVARAMTAYEYDNWLRGWFGSPEAFGWCGNFKGFIQERKFRPNENRKDSRLIHRTWTNSN